MCCSKCGADVAQPAAPTAVPTQQSFQQQLSQLQNAASRLTELTNAPTGQGEFPAGINELGSEAVQAAGRRLGIGSVLAALTAGGASFAAIWNSESYLKLSAAITAAAVVVEVNETGEEIPQNDLTSKIVPFSYDNSLTVAEGGMVSGTYKSAKVTIPEGSSAENGTVSFRYTGEGGTFTKNVVFKPEGPEIVFAQDNLGLPAYYDKASELWFGIIGITDADVTAEFVESGCPYRVALVKDKEVPDLWCARITDSEKKPPRRRNDRKRASARRHKKVHTARYGNGKASAGKDPHEGFCGIRGAQGTDRIVSAV